MGEVCLRQKQSARELCVRERVSNCKREREWETSRLIDANRVRAIDRFCENVANIVACVLVYIQL